MFNLAIDSKLRGCYLVNLRTTVERERDRRIIAVHEWGHSGRP